MFSQEGNKLIAIVSNVLFVMRSVNVSDKRQTNWWSCSFVTPTAALSRFLQFTRSDRTEIRISKNFKTV